MEAGPSRTAMMAAMGRALHLLHSGPRALLAEDGFTVVDDAGAHDIEPRYGQRALNYERMALARSG